MMGDQSADMDGERRAQPSLCRHLALVKPWLSDVEA